MTLLGNSRVDLCRLRPGDVEFIANLVAPGASWRQPNTIPWGGDYVGPAGARDFFAKLNTVYETTVFRINENIVAGDRVVSLGRYEGNARKTGKHGGGNFCFVWTVRDGKVAGYEGILILPPMRPR